MENCVAIDKDGNVYGVFPSENEALEWIENTLKWDKKNRFIIRPFYHSSIG